MKRREKENNIPWKNATKRKSSSSHPKSKKSQTKIKTQMCTKNNTNQQIIPKHNRDNENCDIADKMEYEVNLDKYFLINSLAFEKPEKSSDMLRNAC